MLKEIMSIVVLFSILSTFSISFAEGEENAVYLKGDFVGRNTMLIDGNLITSNGNVTFDSSGGNKVKGDIILNSSKEYIEENKYSKPEVTGSIIKKDSIDFKYNLSDFVQMPEITNVVNNFTATWQNPGEISQDTYFKNLTVNSYLNVDTTSNDVYIIVDNLDMGYSGKINIIGNNKLYLFLKKSVSLKGSSSINSEGNFENVQIYALDGIDVGGGSQVNANIYSQNDDFQIKNGGKIYGNVFSCSKRFSIISGSKIYGTVYAPESDITLESGSNIYGMVIGNSLSMSGNSSVRYDPKYAIADSLAAVQTFLLSITKNIEEAGTVTPVEQKYNLDEKAQISVKANKGYKLVRFENYEDSENIPVNGEIKMTKDTKLTAVFEKVNEEDYTGILIPNNTSNQENILNKITNDYAYFYGYDEVTVAPENAIRRCEAAALIYRLIKQNDLLNDFTKPDNSSFADINTQDWYYCPLEYMTHIGVYNTKGVSRIYPFEYVTRGEVAKMLVFALGIEINDTENPFIDLTSENNFYSYLLTLASKEYMIGDENTIRADDTITRAEFVAIYNRIIGRDDSYDYTTTVDGNSVQCNFNDLFEYKWYYKDIMRATNSFDNFKVDNNKRLDRSELDN